MTDNHPMTPSPSQLDQWEMVARATTDSSLLNEPAIRAGHFGVVHRKALRLAFAAGADMELEACCKWLECNYNYPQANPLRVARRPKPPSLKEQALEVVTGLEKRWDLQCDLTLLRRALEQLND